MSDPTSSTEPLVPRISAILLAYNQAPQLRRAIPALESSHSRDRLEILVLDCASTDGTSALYTEFPSVNILRLPHHLGAARAFNIATRTAKGEFLFFVSPDVEVLPDTAEILASALDEDPVTMAACPLLTDAAGQPTPHIYPLPNPAALPTGPLAPIIPTDLTAPTPIEYPTLDALLVRRGFVQAMNYFDQRYGHYWVDAELAMQIRRAGKKIHLYPAARAIYHPAADPVGSDSLAASDRVVGAAAYASKYGGSGLGLRVGAAFKALARFDFGLFSALLGSQKLDGSQV
jgi:GT2 family glycosyltransferase